ncbi:MAG TPA: DUF3084 domain-containing protein [Candidatus Eremiobacteraceae bacterium]|nr:DUF3084 domain-containing protein [Candidatus Eremiobacteraceae bacterium]
MIAVAVLFAEIAWGPIFIILASVIVAGAIAYIGDRVGHLVGRRRMTIFGLRPKYTSTIFAVGFGMLIAMAVIAVGLSISYDARLALFSLNKLNDQISALTRERDRELQDPVVYFSGQPLTQPVIINSSGTQASIEGQLSALFVDVANLYRSVPGVRPYPKDPLSPEVKESISRAAEGIKALNPVPAIVVPVAGQNIFRDTAMSISFAVFRDVLIYRKGELMGSVPVSSGKDTGKDQAALIQLETSLQRNAEDHGMPNMIADNLTTTEEESAASLRQLTSIDGPALIKAVAPSDIYAHGPLVTMIVVSPLAR